MDTAYSLDSLLEKLKDDWEYIDFYFATRNHRVPIYIPLQPRFLLVNNSNKYSYVLIHKF